jgi:hypothetical protein
MSNANRQHRRSRSTAQAEYERVVLDQMPVAERKRLRAKETKVTKKSVRGSAMSARNPSATRGLARAPEKAESPKHNGRELLYPLTCYAPVPKLVEVTRSPTKARKPVSPLTCTPLVRYSSNDIHQRQRSTRPSALCMGITRTSLEETGLTRPWFDLSRQRNSMCAKQKATRQERMKVASKRVSLDERGDHASRIDHECGDELSFQG